MTLLLIKWINVLPGRRKAGFFDGCRHSARKDSIGSPFGRGDIFCTHLRTRSGQSREKRLRPVGGAELTPGLQQGDVVAILSNGGFDGIYEKLPRHLEEWSRAKP
jgi:hypothetical protein